MYDAFVQYVQSIYGTTDFIALHEPKFGGNEKQYLCEAIDSTFVSSVGTFVDRFEQAFADYIGAEHAVAMINGTAALHIALILSGVEGGDEVICQPLTFVAICNAINYCHASPVFVDIDQDSLSLSPHKLQQFLDQFAFQTDDGITVNKQTGKVIRACIVMHTFGHPGRVDELKAICQEYNIKLLEDAAESLGSYDNGHHVGITSSCGVFSFNGNKIITTGGGGMLVSDNEKFARQAKHITTTAKLPHQWHYEHDTVGYNYRMPNINAALGCAQLEQMSRFVHLKRKLAQRYDGFFKDKAIKFIQEREGCSANYWLNAILLQSVSERDDFLTYTNQAGVMTRPAWQLMSRSMMYRNAFSGNLENAEFMADRLVNIPSSVIVGSPL